MISINRISSTSLFIGLLGGILLFSELATRNRSFNPADAGLGLNTTPHVATVRGRQLSDYATSPQLRETIQKLRKEHRPVALWLGASQLHAVNRYHPGDQIAVYYANERALARGSQLAYVQVSMGNANLNELLGVYLTLRAANLVPQHLIVAMTYDDLREIGIRAIVLSTLPEITDTDVERWGAGLQSLRAARALRDAQPEPVRRTVTTDTPQEALETLLVRNLQIWWPPYALRNTLRARVILESQIALSRVMGHLAQRRVPPIPPDLETWNEEALASLLRIAREDGVGILLYKPPHPQRPGPFYHDRAAYDKFFQDLERASQQQGFRYRDLETIVPVDEWGVTNEGRPDVFHFTDRGHRRLGEAIDKVFEEQVGDAFQ
jgi:hypothetical protein